MLVSGDAVHLHRLARFVRVLQTVGECETALGVSTAQSSDATLLVFGLALSAPRASPPDRSFRLTDVLSLLSLSLFIRYSYERTGLPCCTCSEWL